METILNPRRLAPCVQWALRVAMGNTRVRTAVVRIGAIARTVRANRAVRALVAGASLVAARFKASPTLSGVTASALAILVFIAASPFVFRTVKPMASGIPAPKEISSPAPLPSTPGIGAVPKPAAPAAPAHPPVPLDAPFIDRFGALDESRWYIADRAGNGGWMVNDFRRSQTRITPEGLTISLAKAAPGLAAPVSGGEINTLGRFRYGYFEARVRIPRGPGVVTGLFTYVREKGPDGWNEVDIEFAGNNTRQVELTLHLGKATTHKVLKLPFDAADGFHSYAFDWQADKVVWYVDGRKAHEERGVVAAGLTRPQNYFIDLWASESMPGWLGRFDRAGGPYTATIACVAYARSYAGKPLCGDGAASPAQAPSR